MGRIDRAARLLPKFFASAIVILIGCAGVTPTWYPGEPRAERTGAYEWFLIATGRGDGGDRIDSCDAADEQARAQLALLLLDRAQTQSEVVAAAGGPSRVEAVLRDFAAEESLSAPRTEEMYDDARRRCWVELRWLLPRNLANAVRRVVDERSTREEDVAVEMRRALATDPDAVDEEERQPIEEREPSRAPTVEAAIEAVYPGWYQRVLPVPDCDSHRVAFVGLPGGGEERWLDVKRTDDGWVIVEDERIPAEGWPTPPDIGWCD